jgi:tetratricopeptide (TPR) repeat protein
LGALATTQTAAWSQTATGAALPAAAKPLHSQGAHEENRREAQKLYGLGLLRLHADRLVDALRIFEQALALDPQSRALHKIVIPLYVALGRTDDALTACRTTLALDPQDHETWAIYARQLKGQGQEKEACRALEKALACPDLREHLELRLQVLNELGRLSQANDEHERALGAFSEMVKLLGEPRTGKEIGLSVDETREQLARTYERMIRVSIAARQFDRASAIFEETSKRFPQIASGLEFHMAKVELAREQPEKALAHVEAYLRTQPQGDEAYEVWIDALKHLHRENEIIDSLEHFSQQDAFNVPLRLLLAREYAGAGKIKNAEDTYLQLAEQAPAAPVYRGLFKVWHDSGRMEEVLDQLDAAINKSEKSREQSGDALAAARARAMLAALREDPVLARALLPVGQQRLRAGLSLHTQTLYFLAVFAGRVHQLAEAEAFYRRCLEEHRSDGQQEYAYYSGLINVLWEAHKFDALVDACREGLGKARATNLLLFHRNLAQALATIGKAEEAAQEADKGVEMADDRTRFGMRLNRIYVLDRVGQFTQAVTEAQALLKEYTEPGQIRDVRYRLSSVYASMRDFARAEEQLRLILQVDPNDAGACNDLGYFLADQGKNLDEAEKLIRKAIRLDDEQRRTSKEIGFDVDQGTAAYLDSLGWVLFRRGKPEEARAWLEKASRLAAAESDPTIWDHLGDACFRMHDRPAARLAWQRSLSLYETTRQKRADEHYNELKHKLQILDSEALQR